MAIKEKDTNKKQFDDLSWLDDISEEKTEENKIASTQTQPIVQRKLPPRPNFVRNENSQTIANNDNTSVNNQSQQQVKQESIAISNPNIDGSKVEKLSNIKDEKNKGEKTKKQLSSKGRFAMLIVGAVASFLVAVGMMLLLIVL